MLEREMSKSGLAVNVEAYEPETDPARIDPENLRQSDWPSELVECVRRQRYGSSVLHEFEIRRAQQAK
jgi:hypothetical protein